MPIRPENLARYPKDWSTVVVPRIRARSGNRCECTGQCGLFHHIDPPDDMREGRCRATQGQPHPTTGSTVVLTCMHLNHEPEDCRDENLLHGCQQCHNRYDAPKRRQGIKERARQALGIPDLFDAPPQHLAIRIKANGHDITDKMPLTLAELERQRKAMTNG